jgi:hypothetical protein
MYDDDSTPDPVPISPHKAEVAALANLAMSLNGIALNLTRLTLAIKQVGLTPESRSTIGRELREARDRMDTTANVVDPLPVRGLVTALAPPALARSRHEATLLKNVPPWAQRVITILVGADRRRHRREGGGLEDLKKFGLSVIVGVVGAGIMGTAVPHPADAQRFAPADPPPPNPPAP